MLIPSNLRTILILACLALTASFTVSSAPAQTQIKLREGKIRCFDDLILMSHVAKISGQNAKEIERINSLDLDSFENGKDKVYITRQQVRIRLLLAGLSEDDFDLSGPDLMTVIVGHQGDLRETVEGLLQRQLADQFYLSANDIKVTLATGFESSTLAGAVFSTLRINENHQSELPLGLTKLSATVQSQASQTQHVTIPVSIAIVRDVVRAKTNIQPGQTFTEHNIESIRRPIASRNLRFVSYDQALGSESQGSLQQFELLKSNAVRTVSRSDYAIKRGNLVDVVIHRGALTVRLSGARAEDNGNPGDRIVLENPITGKKILATVVDGSTAEVRF